MKVEHRSPAKQNIILQGMHFVDIIRPSEFLTLKYSVVSNTVLDWLKLNEIFVVSARIGLLLRLLIINYKDLTLK